MTVSGMLRLFERAPEPAHLDVAHSGDVEMRGWARVGTAAFRTAAAF